MTKNHGGLRKAQGLFKKAGLAFPTLPRDLASHLREVDEWCFSTREIRMSPYAIDNFIKEAHAGVIGNYVILAHAGHGVNSYALHYYLVRGVLNLFLQLSWGGVYEDEKKARKNIRDCFTAADDLLKSVSRAEKKGFLGGSSRLTVIGSDLCGSRWADSSAEPSSAPPTSVTKRPIEVIQAATDWVEHLSESAS